MSDKKNKLTEEQKAALREKFKEIRERLRQKK